MGSLKTNIQVTSYRLSRLFKMYIYINICICTCTCTNTNTYTYIYNKTMTLQKSKERYMEEFRGKKRKAEL